MSKYNFGWPSVAQPYGVPWCGWTSPTQAYGMQGSRNHPSDTWRVFSEAEQMMHRIPSSWSQQQWHQRSSGQRCDGKNEGKRQSRSRSRCAKWCERRYAGAKDRSMKGKGKGRIHSGTKGKGKGQRKLQRQILDAVEPGIIEAMQAITYEFKQQIQNMESKIIH
eukprot:7065957-Karenia_brevis.AAC.1